MEECWGLTVDRGQDEKKSDCPTRWRSADSLHSRLIFRLGGTLDSQSHVATGGNRMKNHPINHTLCGVLAALVIGIMPANDAYACSRAVYLGLEDTVITVRSMDWVSDTGLEPLGIPAGYPARRCRRTAIDPLDVQGTEASSPPHSRPALLTA